MTAVLARIALRYVAGALVAKGLFAPEFGDFLTSDPEIAAGLQVGVGLAVGVGVEWAYGLARRLGWST